MKNTKRFISLLLSLLLLMGAVAVGVTTASAEDTYTVILSPGNGTGEPISYRSSEQGEIPYYSNNVGNCQFFYENDGSGKMGFRVDPGYYPDTFQVPEGYKHTGWDPGSVITLTESVTTFTATYGQVLSGDACSCSISPTEWVLNGPGYTDITCTFDSLVSGVVENGEGDFIANTIDLEVFCSELKDGAGHRLKYYFDNAEHNDRTGWRKSFGPFSSPGDTFTVAVYIDPADYANAVPGTYTETHNYSVSWSNSETGGYYGEEYSYNITLVIPAPTEISLDKTEITLYEGDTQQLTPTLAPENSTGKINWTSSDESVATVSDSGLVTAVNADGGSDTEKGTATITATVDGTSLSAACTVNVNHDWGEPEYTWSGDNSTCTATRVCTKDASHKEEETVTAAVTTTATCTEAGITTYTATFENAGFEAQRKEVAVDALGHDWDIDWSYDENVHYHKCLNNGCTETEDEAEHSGGAATCTEKAVCEVCGQAYGSALGHDYIDHPAKKPTATEIGWDAYQTCSRCDYTTYVEKPATGKPDAKATIAIKGDEKAEVKYGGNIIFTAEAENIPEKGKIVWYVNGEKAGEGEKFEAKNAEKDYKVQAKILDKSGNEVAKSKEVSVKVTYTFFDRIVIFFKDLIAKITAIFKK